MLFSIAVVVSRKKSLTCTDEKQTLTAVHDSKFTTLLDSLPE
jgi:hypothetical protein